MHSVLEFTVEFTDDVTGPQRCDDTADAIVLCTTLLPTIYSICLPWVKVDSIIVVVDPPTTDTLVRQTNAVHIICTTDMVLKDKTSEYCCSCHGFSTTLQLKA